MQCSKLLVNMQCGKFWLLETMIVVNTITVLLDKPPWR